MINPQAMTLLFFGVPVENQFGDPNKFDSFCKILYSLNVGSVPMDFVTSIKFSFPLEVNLLDYKS